MAHRRAGTPDAALHPVQGGARREPESIWESQSAEAAPVEVYIDDAGFDSWARGAAAVAIQAALGRLRLLA